VLKVGYTPFFICLGLLDVIGAVILWTVVKTDVKTADAVAV
jgi:ACS family hexuronate transporter-like MFS transporter